MAGITRVSRAGALREQIEQLAVFADGDVIQIGVAAVQQGAHAARLDVPDQLAVFRGVERVIGAAGQRRHSHDGGGELAIEDGGDFHGTSLAACPG